MEDANRNEVYVEVPRYVEAGAFVQPHEVATVDVEVPGIGVVAIRSVSRAEYINAGKLVDETGRTDPLGFERRILAAAMVHPRLHEDQVAAWQKRPGSAPQIQPVMEAIMSASGYREGAPKSGV